MAALGSVIRWDLPGNAGLRGIFLRENFAEEFCQTGFVQFVFCDGDHGAVELFLHRNACVTLMALHEEESQCRHDPATRWQAAGGLVPVRETSGFIARVCEGDGHTPSGPVSPLLQM